MVARIIVQREVKKLILRSFCSKTNQVQENSKHLIHIYKSYILLIRSRPSSFRKTTL